MVDWNEKRMVIFLQQRPGASVATLQQRVQYGGRKGRAAYRRLVRMPRFTVCTAVAMMLTTPAIETK